MAQESGKTASADAYIGSVISLISKSEIRYEGVLYDLNPRDSTLGLNNVRSFGTEGRRKDGPEIPPSDKVYEYILFRGNDIKDLRVKSSPPTQADEIIHNDPAIIQSRFAGAPSSSLKAVPVGESSTDFSCYNDISTLNIKSNTSVVPSHQSSSQVESRNHQAMQNFNMSSYTMPTHWQGYSGGIGNSASQNPMQYTNPSLPIIGNPFESSLNQVSTSTALKYPSNCAAPWPMVVTSSPAHLSTSSHPIGQLPSFSPDFPSSSVKSSLPLYPEGLLGSGLSSSLVPSSSQNRSGIEAPSANKVGSDLVSFHPVQSLSYPVSSVVDSSLGSLLNHPPRLLTPDQLSHPRLSEPSAVQKLYPDQQHMGVLSSVTSSSSSSFISPAVQTPLLPLPTPTQKLQHAPEFAEEFDFEAMNEKFKKDEIWGYFGKVKQDDKTDGTEDNCNAVKNMGDASLVNKVEAKPAYNKDEFFDTISRNSLSRGGRNGQNHFFERRKLNTETFGNYEQRVHPGYSDYGGGRGHYTWGRGYHHGDRGRGRYRRT